MTADNTVNVNTPVTNPELVAAIEAVRANCNAETKATIVNCLTEAHFLSPVSITPPLEPSIDGKSTLRKDTAIGFFALSSANGEFLPAFTDWEELRKWRNDPNEQTLITTYDDLCALIEKGSNYAGFSINPYGHNFLVTREMIQQLNRPTPNPWTVEKETEVLIGTPANYPRELTNAVSKYLKTQKNVKSAHLVLMNNGGESSFLIVVDFIGDLEATFSGIAAVVVPYLKKGELLDMIPLEPGMGETVAKDYPPFYKRKAFGLF